MCGKYVIYLFDEVLDIVHAIEVGRRDDSMPDWPARLTEVGTGSGAVSPSAHPGSAAPVITPRFDTVRGAPIRKGSLEVRELIWGYEADWSGGLVFNTRLDSAAKPLWCDSMEHRRCLVPARMFFEASNTETVSSTRTGKPLKRHYEFRLPDSQPLLIGGIWQDGRYSMVTTDPNADVAPIHHRMPLVVRPEEVPVWLGPDYRSLADRSGIRLDVRPEQRPGQQLSFL